MPSAASSGDHEAALRCLTAKEVWCADLAWEHAATPPRQRLQTEYSVETSAKREQAARARRAAILREIAEGLYVLPKRRRSGTDRLLAEKAQEEYMKYLEESGRRERDLIAICLDPKLPLLRQREARRQFRARRYGFRKRAKQLYREWVKLGFASSSGRPSHEERLRARLCRDGEEAFFAWLDRLIRRCLTAKVRGEWWIKSEPMTRIPEAMSLPQLLALAWASDANSLHAFLRARLLRAQETTAPLGTYRQDVIMHHALSEGVHKEIEGELVGPFKCTWQDLPDVLHKIGAISHDQSNEALKLVDRLRARSSRSIRAAKAAGFRVTTHAHS